MRTQLVQPDPPQSTPAVITTPVCKNRVRFERLPFFPANPPFQLCNRLPGRTNNLPGAPVACQPAHRRHKRHGELGPGVGRRVPLSTCDLFRLRRPGSGTRVIRFRCKRTSIRRVIQPNTMTAELAATFEKTRFEYPLAFSCCARVSKRPRFSALRAAIPSADGKARQHDERCHTEPM